MNIHNFEEWHDWRKRFIASDVATDRLATGARGQYRYTEPQIITNMSTSLLVRSSAASERLKRIVTAETLLMWTGIIVDQEIVDTMYADDVDLLAEYRALCLSTLAGNNGSRNNIISRPKCCLCTWQYTGDTLFVHSRSMDVRAAGLSDPLVVNTIACALDAARWIIYVHQPHVYLDKTKIARRAK